MHPTGLGLKEGKIGVAHPGWIQPVSKEWGLGFFICKMGPQGACIERMESQVLPRCCVALTLMLESYYPEDRGSPQDHNSEQMIMAAPISEWGGLLIFRRVGTRVPALRDGHLCEGFCPRPRLADGDVGGGGQLLPLTPARNRLSLCWSLLLWQCWDMVRTLQNLRRMVPEC